MKKPTLLDKIIGAKHPVQKTFYPPIGVIFLKQNIDHHPSIEARKQMLRDNDIPVEGE